MKEVFCENGTVASSECISADDMKLINSFSKRTMTSDEVYTFNLVLCDNEIDRDFEQFSPSALSELAEMFVGKTGIFDHSLKSRDQTARIFKTKVEQAEGKVNSLGQPYFKLTACAYMPKTEKNASVIAEIDAGILKEISVGCSMGNVSCSVCGSDVRKNPCSHIKGNKYGSKPCYHILSRSLDAYEWSFVAVPAQKSAGVSKSFKLREKGGDKKMTDVFSYLKSEGNEFTITKSQADEIIEKLNSNIKMAMYGEKYCSELTEKAKKLCAVALPEMDSKTFEAITAKLDAEELCSLCDALQKRAAHIIPPTVQLAPEKQKQAAKAHNEFKI